MAIGLPVNAGVRKTVCFFLASISGTGGTERVTSIVANGLSETGYQVHILSLFGGDQSAFPLNRSIALHGMFPDIKPFKWSYFAIIREIRKYLTENKIEVLISTDSMLALYTVPACFKKDVFHIVWEHFNFLTNFGLLSRRISRFLAAKMADVVVVLTQQDLKLWTERIKVRSRIISIPNPISFQAIDVSVRNWDHKLVIAVGRLHYQKGFDLLIRCWRKVAEEMPDWQLYIIGDGPDRESLINLINSSGLNKYVHILPFNHAIPSYYKKASIFCLSSRFEGLPMVLLEAQAFALPSVCFDCYTGPADVIVDGVNGSLVAMKDMAGYSDKIIKLMRDESLRRKMGRSTALALNRYRKDTVLHQWEELIG